MCKGSCVGENVDSEKHILQMHYDRICAKEVVLGKMLIVKNAFLQMHDDRICAKEVVLGKM